MSIQDKFTATRNELKAALIERDQEIDMILTAMIAGEHVLLVGPPGCGKSMLSDAIVRWIHGSQFNLLMTRFTTAEEVFGPVSIKGLKADEYYRVIAKMLPEANVAFLDEIFNASSVILNTLLKVLNERVFQNGTTEIKCPLEICIGASNQWPNAQDGGKELGALFDRFLFRKEVRPIGTERGLEKLLWTDDLSATLTTTITVAELAQAREDARKLDWNDEAKDAFKQILNALESEGIMPSDRRLRKAVGAAKSFAYLNGEPEVTPDSLEVLASILWDDPGEQPKICAKVVGKYANPSGMAINSLLAELVEVKTGVDVKNMADLVIRNKKMEEIIGKLKGIDGRDKKGTKANEAYAHAIAEQKAFKAMVMDA